MTMKSSFRKKTLAIIIAAFVLMAAGLTFLSGDRYVVPVLMYHSIDTDDKLTKLSVSPKSFSRQMEFFSRNKYNVVSLSQVAEYIEKKLKVPAKTVAITFDDGFENNYKYAFPVLKKYNIPATIFIIVERVGSPGYLSWGEIKEMADSGLISIGSHTMSHGFLTSLDENGLRHELGDSKKALEAVIGPGVKYLCYPMGRHSELVKKIAKESGYECAVTTSSSMDTVSDSDRYAIKRVRISRTSDNLFTFWLKTSGYYLWAKRLTR
ncbi:MAG TPA: polysaccharide deacetylase family protein [Candidatus Omnitrophota bacterium]|nr:polysaccharide deacetylase family protein [Candidatus Omnitrophota bacterium]